jgi:hypothetical protein
VNWLETETGETGEQKLVQAAGEAERFYRQLPVPALIGMEATGNSQHSPDPCLQSGMYVCDVVGFERHDFQGVR